MYRSVSERERQATSRHFERSAASVVEEELRWSLDFSGKETDVSSSLGTGVVREGK